MTVPNTRNARIAIAKNWTFIDVEAWGSPVRIWYDSEGVQQAGLFDWTGTLAGVAGLMKDLENALDEYGVPQRWFSWGYNIYTHQYVCLEGVVEIASSPDDRPGDCVGDAWLSVFGRKEDADVE